MVARKRKAIGGDDEEAPGSGRRTQRTKGVDGDYKKEQMTATPASTEEHITRAMTTDASRQAVFATAELLETILMHTPIKNVFVAQRVSTQFRNVVAKSIQLQQKLFLRLPKLQSTERWTVTAAAGQAYFPPMRVVRLESTEALPANVAVTQRGQSCLYKPATLLNPQFEAKHVGERPVVMQDFAMRALYNARHIGLQEVAPRSRALTISGSWRKMYLTDRPCNKAWLKIDWLIATTPPLYGTISGIAETQETRGFTTGALVEAVLDEEQIVYYHCRGAEEICPGKTSVNSLIRKLEIETGKTATVTLLDIQMLDVLLPTDEERAMVEYA
ncbi:hypothetical protein LTR56_022510 [Elasticomyces elasticus]|nr:hypothetical protein LTR56_022510 [Elasticomyces elasticus]KAK3632035.1 hypothetical protein LTR22_020775 [Elasticomyces elasticus]KAK4910040.1 hypothetical protein LTR49_021238 [Elasticomyces elasticus]KAK5749418.1 hypothetical protein LTS12_020528 [Elasticomyces elasticus]